MTNHININFVNEIIKYIENIENINSSNKDLIREDVNNIQENKKLNLKNDDNTKILNDNISAELKNNNDDRKFFK